MTECPERKMLLKYVHRSLVFIEVTTVCLLVAGQKGLEVLQLSLAAVLVFLSVLALLGTGTEGHWALGRAPCGEDPRRDACCCWRRGFLCVSHASTMLLQTGPGSTCEPGESSSSQALGWGHSPR